MRKAIYSQRLHKWELVIWKVSLCVWDSSAPGNQSVWTQRPLRFSLTLLLCVRRSISWVLSSVSTPECSFYTCSSHFWFRAYFLLQAAFYPWLECINLYHPAWHFCPFPPPFCNLKWSCWGKSTAFANGGNMGEFHFQLLLPINLRISYSM